ncbi:MAG: molybdenum cofactor guanylyltransferase MobA [Hyphomicrobium sp.]|jgi:molybdenum cofactor guanylyltransferase/molybdopterin-guanine dinucleotide biosynthesis protein MobB
MMTRDRVAGLLLAGGQSRRMRGGDKALAELGGRSMLAHVMARMQSQVSSMVLSTNGDPAPFAGFGLPIVADAVGGFQGPLAGVLAGLRWAGAHAPEVSHIVSVSTDAPFLPRDLVGQFIQIAGDDLVAKPSRNRVVVAASGGRVHPVIALWPVALADEIEAALGRSENKVQVLQERFGVAVVEYAFKRFGCELVDPFFNVNTPEELEEARGIIAKAEPLVMGIAGWKNSGKTTLVVGLTEELTRRGLRVATVKHSHHEIVGLGEDTDTARHLRAGAVATALVTPSCSGVLPELHEGPEPELGKALSWLRDADLVLVEGYKRAAIRKIELRRRGSVEPGLAETDQLVIAIAADHEVPWARVPVFDLDDIRGLADLIMGLMEN